MTDLISPKYQMKLVKEVGEAIWAEFGSYEQVKYYTLKNGMKTIMNQIVSIIITGRTSK